MKTIFCIFSIMFAMALVVVNLNIAYASNATEDAMRGLTTNDTNAIEEANKLLGEAQSEALTSDIAKYRNCVTSFVKNYFIQLTTDEDCNISQFTEAVKYYKANGYPIESMYMDNILLKLIQLDSAEYAKQEGIIK